MSSDGATQQSLWSSCNGLHRTEQLLYFTLWEEYDQQSSDKDYYFMSYSNMIHRASPRKRARLSIQQLKCLLELGNDLAFTYFNRMELKGHFVYYSKVTISGILASWMT